VIDLHCHTKFREKRGTVGPPLEKFYICEALGLNLWHFLSKFANKLHILQKYFITQILPENVKILTCILHDFTVGGSFTPPPPPPTLPGRYVPDNYSL
jgi:hypothetical protein